MNPRRQKRLAALLGVLVLIGGAIGLMLYALNENIDLFYTPSEIVEGKNGTMPQVGQRLRIGGVGGEDSVRRDSESRAEGSELGEVGDIDRSRYAVVSHDPTLRVTRIAAPTA